MRPREPATCRPNFRNLLRLLSTGMIRTPLEFAALKLSASESALQSGSCTAILSRPQF